MHRVNPIALERWRYRLTQRQLNRLNFKERAKKHVNREKLQIKSRRLLSLAKRWKERTGILGELLPAQLSPRFVLDPFTCKLLAQRLPNTVQLEIGWLFRCNWKINPASDDSIFRGTVLYRWRYATPRHAKLWYTTSRSWKSSGATSWRVEGSSGIKIVIRDP